MYVCGWSAAWDGELDLELSLGCAGSDPSTVAVDALSYPPSSKQRTMTLTVCSMHST